MDNCTIYMGCCLSLKHMMQNQNEESNLTASWAGGEVGGVAMEVMGGMIYEGAYD
jgi:hypothetical protein